MGFIRLPYLPKGKVSIAVGDISVPGIKVIPPYEVAALRGGMRRHGDITFSYLGDGVAICAPEAYDYYSHALESLPIKLVKGNCPVGSNYPWDAAYNIAIVGERIFCRVDITDSVVLKKATEMGYKIINIKQGYAKCSVCPVDENSAISADMSFYKAASKEGIEVLLTDNCPIVLEGYPNGFFGGAAYMEGAGVFSAKGDVRLLADYEKIKLFLEKRNISIKYREGSVTDFGSFIPLWEE